MIKKIFVGLFIGFALVIVYVGINPGAPKGIPLEEINMPYNKDRGTFVDNVKQAFKKTLKPILEKRPEQPLYETSQSSYAMKKDHGNLGVFDERGRASIEAAKKHMRQLELSTLKDAIQNDEKSLAQIEKSGTDIEMYKFIEENLEKRKLRLQQMLSEDASAKKQSIDR